MATAHRILIVNAEAQAGDHLEKILREEGFHVITDTCGREALRAVLKEAPDLMIIDLGLPDVEPHEICRIIRETPQTRTVPILAVSESDPKGLAVRCLNNGADGHLSNAVGRQELIAHVRALLRRPKIYLSERDVIQRGRITLRLGERRVLFDDKEIFALTPKEYALLKELILRAPRVVEKGGLVIKVWGVPLEQLGRKTLDVHIQRIRKKLGLDGASLLKTVSLVGYQWLENTHGQRLSA